MASLVQLPPAFESFSKDFIQLPDSDQAEYQEAFSSRLGLPKETKGFGIMETLKVAHKRGHLDDGDAACRMLSDFAKKTSNPKQFEKIIEKHKPSFPKREAEFVGRAEDVKNITERLRNKVIPGINLFGESGVGKTTLAQEVAKEFGEFEVRAIDLRDIQDMETVCTLILLKFGVQLKSKSSLDKVYECLDKTLTQKTLVILDNVEQLLKETKKEFIGFLKDVFETKACKNKLLKLILTSQDELKEPSLKGKFFSEYKVKQLDPEISQNFITKRRNDVIGVPEEESDEVLTEISKICRNLPYLLQVTEQLIRSSSSTTDVLQNLTTKIEQNVPEQFACVSVLFDSLPSVHLKEVAVKMSLLRRPFSVSTAMKIAEIYSDHDARLDLEMLANWKLISIVDVNGKRKYDTHGLFKEFIKYLCGSQPKLDSSLKQGQKQFFEHFSGKMSKLAKNLENEFVKTYSKLELNTANFELALDLSEENKEALDLLLHTDDHNHFVLMGIMFEVLKDVDERRDLFAKWADATEKQKKWLASAFMRCWQSLQCTDTEGRRLAQPTLDKAHECLKKAEQTASSDQMKEVRSLYLHSSGKIKYYRATKCARGSKERKDLLKEGIEDLKKAISIRNEILEDSTLTSRGWNLIGNCYLDLDEPEEALVYYKDAMEMKKRLVGSYEHWEFPTFYNQIAQVHDQIGRKHEEGAFSSLRGGKKKAIKEYEKAAKMTKKALDLQEKLEVSGTQHTATFQRNLANILLGLGKYDEALEWAQKSYEIRKKLLGKHPDTVRILYTIGMIHEWRGDPEAALQSYEEGVEMEESLPEDGHSAVRNQLYERIEEMCSRVKKKYPKAEKHPEKVRILYLTGVCQEFKEDTKALQSYEKAFEMEEYLPEDNHSLVRKKLYQRLAGMYKKLDQKDKLRKIEIKINKIMEQEEELETGVWEPSEFEMNVYKNGGYYNHSKYGHFIYVPPNTVTEPTKITCKVSSTHPILSPAKFTEGLASYIVELGPATVALQKPIIMTLLHSGPVKRHGYEVTVRTFNAIDKSWKDIEVLQEDSHAPEYCECRYLQVSLQKLSTLAVVTRLITDRFQVTPKGCVFRSSVCHGVTVEFPEGAVEKTVEGILNILPEERIVIKDSIVARPALLFHGFQSVMFSKPVTIRVPFVPSITPGSFPLLLRLDFDDQSKGQWKNVADFNLKNGVMEFSVDHFSGFWPLMILNVPAKYVVDSVSSCYQYWFDTPSDVTFAAYMNKEHDQDVDLQLTCVANHKQDALNDKMKDSCNRLIAQSNGDLPMRYREEAYLKVEGVSPSEEGFFLRFLGQDKEESKQFYGTPQEGCRVTKLSYFNECENRLCTLRFPIKRNLEKNNVFSHTQDPCKEYFGITLDVLKDSPDDIKGKMLKHLEIEGSRLNDWDTESVIIFYSSLPRNEDCYKDLVTCLDSFEGSKHLSRYLRKGHDLVKAPMTSLKQDTQNRVMKIVASNTGYSLSGLADYLEVKEFVNECREKYEGDEQVSQLLRKWMVVRNECSTIEALFQALQHLKLSKVEEELAKYTTELSKKGG